MIKSKFPGNSNIKIPSLCICGYDFLSSHMAKPYDISCKDFLADRTSSVHVYLMFVDYRMKGLKYYVLSVCACVCLCMYFFIFISYYICRQ